MDDQTIRIPEIKCLDHGWVRLVDHMGDDTRIVDAARVSYQQGTKAVQSDRHLIRYLIRNHHTTPLEKVVLEFHVKLPIFIARQWMRHRSGSFNEVSARYSVMKDEFYIPDPLRKQSSNNRQGSSDEIIERIEWEGTEWEDGDTKAQDYIEQVHLDAYMNYQTLLNAGTARELARIVLPVSLYTEFYWTVSLWNLMHFLKLRLDPHAQMEIRVFGEAIYQLLKDNCNLQYSLEAFQDYILNDPKFSKYELQIIKKALCKGPHADNQELQKQLNKEYIQRLIEAHPDMSKREKQESKLIELLFEEEENDTKETEIQSNISKESFTDS
jgi:thymidylate synthase (FAD)